MARSVGDQIPSATVTLATAEGPKPAQSEELFKGKKVLLFAVPGAFTPLCSGQHLPGYIAKADSIAAKGIDEILCLSVNDAFVMDAWGKALGAAGKVGLVADGNALFTKAMGLELDATPMQMGVRSQRYAMLVEDGVIKDLQVEEGRSFEVSSAEHMLDRI